MRTPEELLSYAMYQARMARRTPRVEVQPPAKPRPPRNLSTRDQRFIPRPRPPVIEEKTPADRSLSLAEIRAAVLPPPGYVTTKTIIHAVSVVFDIGMDDLVGCRRLQPISRARQVCSYLANRLTKASLPMIGKALGGKDHTTVLHGIRMITELRTQNVELDRMITLCESKLHYEE